MTERMKGLVIVALNDSTLCNQFIKQATVLNVTSLTSPTGLADTNDFCRQTASFRVVTILNSGPQPSSQPSSMPSIYVKIKSAIKPKVKVILSDTCVSFLAMIMLIWFLRIIHPMFIEYLVTKKIPKIQYLYDIVVILNENEVAILENIRHKDITFFRRTKIENESQTLDWVMNVSNVLLEKQFEVQFYDQYDLLGPSKLNKNMKESREGRDDVVHIHKRTKSGSSFEYGDLQIGMITRVKVLQAEDDNSRSTSLTDPELCGCINNALKSKPTRRDTSSTNSSSHRRDHNLSGSLKGISGGRRKSSEGCTGINPMRKDMIYDLGLSDSDEEKDDTKKNVREGRRRLSVGAGKNARERHRLHHLVHSDNNSSTDEVSIDLAPFMPRQISQLPRAGQWPVHMSRRRKTIEDRIGEEEMVEESDDFKNNDFVYSRPLSRSSYDHSPVGFASSLSSLSLNSEEYEAMFRNDVTFNKPWLLGRYAGSRGSLSISEESVDINYNGNENNSNSDIFGDTTMSSSCKWRIILDSPMRKGLMGRNINVEKEMEREIEGKEVIEEQNERTVSVEKGMDISDSDASQGKIDSSFPTDNDDDASVKSKRKSFSSVRHEIESINKICLERNEIENRKRISSGKGEIEMKKKICIGKNEIQGSNNIQENREICMTETKDAENQWNNSVLRKLFIAEDFNEEKAD